MEKEIRFFGELLVDRQTGKYIHHKNLAKAKFYRVKNGTFKIDGIEYELSRNDFGNSFKHHLHGGYKSFDRLNWRTSLTEEKDGVIFSLLSPHGSEVKENGGGS